MVQSFINLNKFLGTNNTSDLFSNRILSHGIYLYECDNVDIDDEGKPHRRDGDNSKIVNSSTVHSIWSDGEIFLYADGTVLKRLNRDDTVTTMITDIDPSDHMCYVKDNNQIFFANNSIIGYIIDGLPYPFPDPAQTFKIRMVGGHLLEIFNRRLYAANGANLFFSDATVLTRMDKRKNAIAFSDRLTMVKAVKDGLYVGTNKAVIFLGGSGPEDFVQTKISDIGVIEGTAVTAEGDSINKYDVVGTTIYWTSVTGSVYKGYPGGIVTECQDGLFAMSDLDLGTSIMSFKNGYWQYMAVCPLIPGIGGATGEIRITRPSAVGLD